MSYYALFKKLLLLRKLSDFLCNPTSFNTIALFFLEKRSLQTQVIHPSRGIAPSGFRPLRKIPHCCLPKESGPYLSPNVADRSLKPATDNGLGKPLTYQLANQTRAHSQAASLSYFTSQLYKDLAVVSNSYSFPEGRFSCVLHPFATKDKNFRSTCMCKAYRQRSSWARIKLSMILCFLVKAITFLFYTLHIHYTAFLFPL